MDRSERLDAVRAYHERTKHHFNRFALSLGYMDWANQPDPHLKFEGAPETLLPLSSSSASPSYESVYQALSGPSPVTADTLGTFFEHAYGLSAIKSIPGAQWSLRCNPSSGNLHPTEAYLVCGAVEGLHTAPAVYHYRSDMHGLERRNVFDVDDWKKASVDFPDGAFFVVLTSIHWREAWKYGERAYRYCQHDLGHAIATAAYSAAAHGWRTVLLEGMTDNAVCGLVGLKEDGPRLDLDREFPGCVLAVIPSSKATEAPLQIDLRPTGSWLGTAQPLSPDHVEWPVIDQAAEAAVKDTGDASTRRIVDRNAKTSQHGCALSAFEIYRQRRSAVAMDGRTRIGAEDFYLAMQRVMPNDNALIANALGSHAHIHLAIFVHRVDDVAPGLYFLIRDPDFEGSVRASLHSQFRWQRPENCPDDLPLYLLDEAGYRQRAMQLACGQDIASDGVFSMAMMAAFEKGLEEYGPYGYRRLHWEAGFVGQVSYLEAEAMGIRSTGIGCFFDDPTRATLGIDGYDYQCLYQFTVGGAVHDERLTTLPPYSAERRAFRMNGGHA